MNTAERNGSSGPSTRQARTVEELARAILRRQLPLMIRHRAGALTEEDPEHLHEIRVGLRRARLCARLFKRALPSWASELQDVLESLDAKLGPARDADVVAVLLHKRATKLGLADRDLASLTASVETWRARSHVPAFKAIGSRQFDRLGHFLERATETPDQKQNRLSKTVASEILRKRAKACIKAVDGLGARGPKPASVHKLRISVRRLRYALEFLKPVAGPEAASVLKSLVELQRVLGDHHDLTLALAFLKGSGFRGPGHDALRSSLKKRRRKAESKVLESRTQPPWAPLRP